MSVSHLQKSTQPAISLNQDVICEGWVLKKRRRKMQGFARRYFVLRQSGILSYSVDPKHPDIHLDSSNATFHIKCLSVEDFDTWMAAFSQEIHRDRWSQDIGSVFSMFKKSGNHATNEDGTSLRPHLDSNFHIHLQRINIALEYLKSQHAALLISLHATTPPTVRGSTLPMTAEEKVEGLLPSRFSTPFSRRSIPMSSMTDLSDGGPVEWFDAEDNVGEEFILEDPTPDEEKARPILESASSSFGQYESASSDEEDLVPPRTVGEHDPSVKARQVLRRTHLPSGPVGDEGSLFAMLKNNVGKDLSTIAFPVSFNEPLTLLQRTAEELEYHALLQQAVEANDPVERMCFVAAFAISGYAHTRHRSGRKGFNPMLAETFEDVRMKFLAEKVSHNPVVIAYHAEGDGWVLNATSAGKTKFWGKSLEMPSSFMRNLMMGTKYLEHCGQMRVKNTISGASCVIDFKQTGYWGASNEVAGTVLSSSGDVCARIEGKWDDQIALTLDSSHLRILWRITPFPKQTLEYYGFTAFGITLNEITDDLHGKLPPTDSRFRPDVRALEGGNVDEAEVQKARLEELQRDRRRRGVDRTPQWFRQVGEDWQYTGGYWEARARGWKESKVEPLW
ncbi:hypothetical protein BU15DRAFT_86344 [Melanogaster broomeanus]|nr:hypothetical protein BU15DRAFT_86344 [Melanogaster broomeanus]